MAQTFNNEPEDAVKSVQGPLKVLGALIALTALTVGGAFVYLYTHPNF